MLKRYSEQEMLDYWKGRLGISVSPAVAGYRDRTALDRKILDEVDLWYEEMLQSAPFDKVPVSDMAEAVSCRRLTDNSVEIALPEEEAEEGTAGETALWHRPYVKKLQMVTRPAKGTYVLDPVLLRRSELRVH